ncbi:hypothetical protein Cni_G22158 [Canna indica]|uniref:Myb/SANT-like domain-containing protein n=1 Tax=Canna indica TaxID=4628 RepID=A0AAQ3KUL8_9LILI|nr:hypothetical protein Cni_G22158 [Canna indica]
MENSQSNQACSSHGKKIYNFKWKSIESAVLLDYLVEQVQSGDRFEKGFKDSQISEVVNILNEKNHPKDAKLINKPIDFYDQISIIFGGSLATGRWSKDDNDSLGAPESEDNVEFANPKVNVHTNDVSIDSINAQAHSTQGASLSSGKTKKKSSKRHRENEDDIMTMIANNIKELAVAIKEYNEPEISIDGLYEVVMLIPGFDESQLCHAYCMLVGSSTREARAFMVASTHHRYFWIRDMLNM